MSTKLNFARAIYYARKERGLTQQQVAEALSISVNWLKKLEKGRALPGADLLIRFAVFYDLDVRLLVSSPPLYRYTAEQERHYRPEVGLYTTYACHMYRWSGTDWEELEVLSDISDDRERAEAFAALCTLEQVEPCHVRDVLEDQLGVTAG